MAKAARSASGLKFMGATNDLSTVIGVGAFEGYLDKRVIALATESLKLLGSCIGNARAVAKDRESSPQLEILLGLSLLAFAEFQALLVLCSAGMERSARIHMRSLGEYKIRADILLSDKSKADEFILAALAELEYLGALISADPNVIEAAKERFLGPVEKSASPKREKQVLGDMRALLRKGSGDRTYGATFAWPSIFSHGSILALDEVSRKLEHIGPNFQTDLLRDGGGFVYVNTAVLVGCHFALLLAQHFRIDASDKLADLMRRQEALASEAGLLRNPYDSTSPVF